MNDRRRPGSTAPRAASPAVAVGVAIVGAILGFLILKQFDNGGTAANAPSSESEDQATTVPGQIVPDTVVLADGSIVTVLPTSPATVPPPVVTPGRNSYTVIVGNASKQKGTAGALTDDLARAGFRTGPATNAVPSDALVLPIPATRILVDPGMEAAATDLIAFLGVGAQEVMPTGGAPVESASSDARIVILLGTDLAGKVPAGSSAVQGAPVAVPPAETTPNAAPPAT